MFDQGVSITDKQKHAAVQHYQDHDRCIASMIKALGYPCRATLTEWLDEMYPEVLKRIAGRSASIQHPLELKNAALIKMSPIEYEESLGYAV